MISSYQLETNKPTTTLTTNNNPVTPRDKLNVVSSSITPSTVFRPKLRQSKYIQSRFVLPDIATTHDPDTPKLPTSYPIYNHYTCAIQSFDPTTSYPLEYCHIVRGIDKPLCTISFANDLGRLAKGVGIRMPTGTNTIHFIARKSIPTRYTVTYRRIQPHRVRLTVSNNRINYSSNKSTPKAEIQTIKALLNTTISTLNATLSTADIKDFYLNTPLSTFEYIRFPINIIPEEIILQYNLLSLVVDGYVYI